MKDNEHKLNEMEARLKLSTETEKKMEKQEKEVDLFALLEFVWTGKLFIIVVTGLFFFFAVIYSLSLPNYYKSEMILASSQVESGGGLASMSNKLGGLASIAGISMGSGDSARISHAVELLKSRPFLENMIIQQKLKHLLLAIEEWDNETGGVVYHSELYDKDNEKWVEGKEPSDWEAYLALNQLLIVDMNGKTGMIKVSVEHQSPKVAEQICRILLREVNLYFQNKDISNAQKNIDYLKDKITETEVVDMQSVFYSLIESQLKTLMLAEVSNEYLLQAVVAPMVAAQKSGPNRTSIVMVGTFLGGCLSILVLFGRKFYEIKALKKS
ncbi:Wzz/FepE/Etk N-terminal domain-containing protein [Catenovulum agarivorans]|uniref:Wzz/FepE/Etk N-terminal domain-containing protein n=1 Tax=Catenovulum agarivorans TaxID=1172192 RepID=UPI0002E2EE7F|nr:Wzz/FepE/Etk N-terminal domain-containing protein [Catenovulum agarivorans]